MKSANPLVDEVRAARNALAKKSGNDLQKIVDAARVRQGRSRHKLETQVRTKTKASKRAQTAASCSRRTRDPGHRLSRSSYLPSLGR